MIRLKNLDLETEGMKRHGDTYLGDITATREVTLFVAPIDCVINLLDIYNNPNQAVTTSPVVSVYLATATASLLAANHTATLSAGARLRFTPSANNSLTAGTRIAASFNISGSSNWSAAICHVKYTPLKHRNTI